MMIRTITRQKVLTFKKKSEAPCGNHLDIKFISYRYYHTSNINESNVYSMRLRSHRCKNLHLKNNLIRMKPFQVLLYSTDANSSLNLDKSSHTIKIDPPKPKSLLAKYASLSKFRLSSLVIFTSVLGNLLAPGPVDLLLLTSTTIGTALTCFSANSINQYIEVDNDLKMKRTRNRMLPTGQLSLRHALAFGVITGTVGTCILALNANPLAASLAFSNILLYTLVYTPMKRIHPINTWIGSIVGAIPPMIGWAAQTGSLEPGAWVLCLILLLWQMPHFYALSYPLRFDYGNAGYKMLANIHPEKGLFILYYLKLIY